MKLFLGNFHKRICEWKAWLLSVLVHKINGGSVLPTEVKSRPAFFFQPADPSMNGDAVCSLFSTVSGTTCDTQGNGFLQGSGWQLSLICFSVPRRARDSNEKTVFDTRNDSNCNSVLRLLRTQKNTCIICVSNTVRCEDDFSLEFLE